MVTENQIIGGTNDADTKLLSFTVHVSDIGRRPADNRYCVASVHNGSGHVGFHQCSRKPKHEYGGHGWCAQHYPPNEHKRREERHAAWKAEWKAREEGWAREAAEAKQKAAALEAIKKIAAGHNDPRGLAEEVLSIIPTQEP